MGVECVQRSVLAIGSRTPSIRLGLRRMDLAQAPTPNDTYRPYSQLTQPELFHPHTHTTDYNTDDSRCGGPVVSAALQRLPV